MQTEFLAAVAESLRNFGFEDAEATETYVKVRMIRFQIRTRYRSRSFEFCGRTYRSGNVLQAVMDLIQELPRLIAYREKELEQYKRDLSLNTLNESLKGHELHITRNGDKHTLTYTADLNRLETVAKQIAAAEDIILASLDNELSKFTTIFTSEGGFYNGN